MSGTDDARLHPRVPPNTQADPAFDRLWRVLNRQTAVESLTELWNGLDPSARRPPLSNDAQVALGFDTNAIYRVGLNGTRGADSVDYLRQRHRGPVIIPGQAVQELWNNILAGVEPQARRLRKAFDDLSNEAAAIDQRLGPLGDSVSEAIESLVRAHGDWIDPASHGLFDGTLEALLSVGTTSYAPRDELYDLAKIRKETRTPPGFRDGSGNHGDFYLWADFLYGLASADLSNVDAAVFVTNDVKPDWSRNGVAHPLLVAEAIAVAGMPFRLWTVPDFQQYARREQA